MLGDHYMDGEFRERFRDVVGGDVRRIENAVHQLENAADASAARTATVDVTALLDGLLDAESDRIQLRRLLVLKELDRSHPDALVDGASLRDALAGVIGRAIATVPERSDLYLASKHHAQGRGSGPSIRVLLRYSTSAGEVSASNDGGAPTLRGHEIEHASAETTINALGGTFTVDNTDANETVIVIDLPAPQS